MRTLSAAALAVILVASGPVSAIGQSQSSVVQPGAAQPGGPQPSVLTPDNSGQNNNVIAVPPAPLIVASPPSPATPQTPAPPSFLVPLSPPSSTGSDNGDADQSNSDTGNTQSPETSGSAITPIQAAPAGSSLPAAPGPAAPGPAAPGPAAPGQEAAPQSQALDQDTIPTPPNTWQPGKFAEIGVLDKIDGEVIQLSVPVGGQSVVGDLQVNVLACVTRPPDQVPDAAVFLALQSTDNPTGPPNYRGWLIRSEPGAAVAGDASETFRIIDCS